MKLSVRAVRKSGHKLSVMIVRRWKCCFLNQISWDPPRYNTISEIHKKFLITFLGILNFTTLKKWRSTRQLSIINNLSRKLQKLLPILLRIFTDRNQQRIFKQDNYCHILNLRKHRSFCSAFWVIWRLYLKWKYLRLFEGKWLHHKIQHNTWSLRGARVWCHKLIVCNDTGGSRDVI